MKAILSLDIGSSSAKVGFYGLDGQRLPGEHFTSHHNLDESVGGGRWTLDPSALETQIVQLLLRALSNHPEAEIVAVAFCTFWHSFVGVDGENQAQTPISMWADTRATDQARRLHTLLDSDYTQRTGCPIHTSYPPARLLWLFENQPDVYAHCARFVSPGAYLYGRLFGWEHVAESVSMASATGLYDQTTQTWDAKSLAVLPDMTPARLLPVSDAPMSGLVPMYRTTLPRLADIPWFPALGDGACSNLGCGAVTPDRIALMIGTSGALRVGLPDKTPPFVPPGLWRYQADGARFLLGGALSNGGNVWDWVTKTFQTEAHDDALEDVIAALRPDGHGLTVLPFLHGERAPLWQDGLTSTLHGLTGATKSEEIIQAYIEAIAYRFALLRAALANVAPHAQIVGTGAGLIASPIWSQIIADALGETLVVVDEPQASSRGAALWVRERLGMGKIEDAPHPAVIAEYTPDAANTAIYVKARARQEDLRMLLASFPDAVAGSKG